MHVWSDLSQIFECFKKKTYQVKFLVAALQCLCECTQWAAWKWLVLKNIWTIFDISSIYHKRVQVFDYIHIHTCTLYIPQNGKASRKQWQSCQTGNELAKLQMMEIFFCQYPRFPFIEMEEIRKKQPEDIRFKLLNYESLVLIR